MILWHQASPVPQDVTFHQYQVKKVLPGTLGHLEHLVLTGILASLERKECRVTQADPGQMDHLEILDHLHISPSNLASTRVLL